MAVSSRRSPKLLIARPLSHAHARSPSVRSNPASNSVGRDQSIEFLRKEERDFGGVDQNDGKHNNNGNKVMVVVDSSSESMGALEWALSHEIQSQDTIILLYVMKLSRNGLECSMKFILTTQQLLQSMKTMCQRKRPGVQVEVAIMETKEKGQAIVKEAKRQRAKLLVLGQRKRPIVWQLIRTWASKRKNGVGTVQYCIQNASCTTVAVRRKDRKLGGYLITTKRHKNFWLLA